MADLHCSDARRAVLRSWVRSATASALVEALGKAADVLMSADDLVDVEKRTVDEDFRVRCSLAVTEAARRLETYDAV